MTTTRTNYNGLPEEFGTGETFDYERECKLDQQYAYNQGYEDGKNSRPNRELKLDWYGCEDDYDEGYAEGLDDRAEYEAQRERAWIIENAAERRAEMHAEDGLTGFDGADY